MDGIIDIEDMTETPPHEPMALAKEMVKRAPDCKAGVCILVTKTGGIWYDMAGHERQEILWALQRMIHRLMDEPIEWE